MKKLIAVTLSALPLFGNAAPANGLPDAFFNPVNPTLTTAEKASLDTAQRSQAMTTSTPSIGPGGAVVFPYGLGETGLLTAVLQITDFALQPGEAVNSVDLGDPVRWSVTPAVEGSGASQTLHLIIKPLDVGLDTTLVVATDRRVYHFRLRSTRDQFIKYAKFSYPEEAQAKWDAVRQQAVKERHDNTIPATGEYLGDLDFNYTVTGKAPWKPLRVYHDKRKTIIQMPFAMKQTEAPVLLVLRKEGGVFSKEVTEEITADLKGDRFIVDRILDKAILVSGVGSDQERVTIERGD
ncbi:P-type conjugative transfer protein TrbG [Burkholderia aenigmatica]|uniref:P-type conjugative transfer protein TrbG n=1 Tax=Burkholderia aenigmatica TaxID=2015348 RepID=UPI002654E84F|nr:P-type conjugative transfer protein TrbG [Burkholderia aenigmatica]MDN7880114.1 P-type conjugative transfer protein TrbG [Burkholderia aenigmatica]